MLADKLRSVSQQVVPPSGEFGYVGSTSANAATNVLSLAIDKPANVAVGDLLVAILVSGNTPTVTSSGWTQQFAGNTRYVFTKLVESGDGATYTFNQNISTTFGGSILAFTNAAFDIIGTISASANPSVAPSITLSTSAFVVDFLSNSGTSFTTTVPAGWIQLVTDAAAPEAEAIGRFFAAGETGTVSVTVTSPARSILFSITPTATMAARFVAVAHGTTPFISVYPFLENAGFGQRMANPATLPVGTGNSVAFTASGDAIAIAHNTTGVSAYPWSIDGFGTRFTDPATMPVGTGLSVAFNDAEDAIIVGHSTTPFISAYPWSTSGFGTKYTNPASVPSGAGNGVSFNPGGAYVAVAHTSGTCLSVYPWAAGFGTKITPSGTTLGSPCYSANFAPDNSGIAVSGGVTPYIAGYPWSGSFGTRYADPATLPPGSSDTIIFSPSGTTVAVAHSTTPFISAYAWSAGFGSKYADPASLPGSTGRGVVFSDTEQTVFYVSASTPFVAAYKWSSGFGDKYANPSPLPPAAALDVGFCKITL